MHRARDLGKIGAGLGEGGTTAGSAPALIFATARTKPLRRTRCAQPRARNRKWREGDLPNRIRARARASHSAEILSSRVSCRTAACCLKRDSRVADRSSRGPSRSTSRREDCRERRQVARAAARSDHARSCRRRDAGRHRQSGGTEPAANLADPPRHAIIQQRGGRPYIEILQVKKG